MVVSRYHYQSDSRRSKGEIPDQPAESGEVVAAMQHQESRLPADSAIWSACFKLGAVIRLKAANDPNRPKAVGGTFPAERTEHSLNGHSSGATVD
jgi:hypothetical protein